MAAVVHKNDLPGNETLRQFEGYLYDAATLSFFISETSLGRVPSLHKHLYEEVL